MQPQKQKRLIYKFFKKRIRIFDLINTNVHFQDEIVNNAGNAAVFEDGTKKRSELWKFCLNKIENHSTDYLEFGVYEGGSIKWWSENMKNPECRLFGFDSFEGLPEDWKTGSIGGEIQKLGLFDRGGKIPQINDKRVVFVKGLFQDTLQNFISNYKPQSRIIVHIDSDLYSSALFCLTKLDHLMKKRTIIIFDEFLLLHEFLSFHDYIRSYSRKYSVIARTKNFGQLAIELSD